jgi:diguanylate cyclase (GGDEF)-like protein
MPRTRKALDVVTPAPSTPDRRLRRMVAVAGAAVLAEMVMIAVGTVTGLHPLAVWVPPFAALLAAVPASLAAAQIVTSPALRAFWRWLAGTAGLFTAAACSQAVDVLTARAWNGLPPISDRTLVLYLVATGVVVIALLRLPVVRHGWRRRLATHLDVAIVGAAAVMAGSQYLRWFSVDVGAGEPNPLLDLGVLVIAAAGFVAVVKVMVAGQATIARGTLWWLAPAGALGPVSVPLMVLLQPWPHLNGSAAVLPAAGLLFTLAAAAQAKAPTVAPAAGPVPVSTSRRDSAVPLTASGLTTVLLLAVHARTGHLPPALEAGAAVLLLLVITRQALTMADQRHLLHRVEHQANHDRLTGLHNRHAFSAAIAAPAADGRARTVVLVDIDDFGAINNGLGPTAGDLLLLAYADRLRAVAGDTAFVARLEADAFGLLLPAAHADDLLDRLLDAGREALHVDGHYVHATVSAGIATADPDQTGDLLRRADIALRAAATGESRVIPYTPDLEQQQAARTRLIGDLRRGMDEREFHLLYQPIVDLTDNSLVSVEALIRWTRSDGSTMSPADFIPVAEHSGLIVELGAWIIDTACAQAATWQRQHGDRAPRVAINVSARQLLDPALPGTITAALRRHAVAAHTLTIELTETAVFGGGPALATVHALADLGLNIALDDFGTGHSSLSLLRTCPVTTLKVDKSFVDGLNGTPEQEAIVTALPGIAATLHLSTVAEGVETAAQASRLTELGYRYAQGFHFSKPIPPNAVDALLTAGTHATERTRTAASSR